MGRLNSALTSTAFILFFGMHNIVAKSQVAFPVLSATDSVYSMESMDWGVSPTSIAKKKPYHAPTPMSIPGARVISTMALQQLLRENKDVVVVDVLDSKTRKSIPGAVWLSGAGSADFYVAEKERFAAVMNKLTGGDKARPVVFLCISSECWLSYNASLHALDAGYKDVIWYRGGTNAWRGANLSLKASEAMEW